MVKRYRVRIFCGDDLLYRWIINEKQKSMIDALIEADLFFEDIHFEIEEDTEIYRNLT